jgi:hypothetical protein
MIQMPEWLKDKELTAKEQGNAAEKAVRQTFASGAFWHDKGDVETEEYLLDVKSTKAKSFSIQLEDWYKITKEARGKKKTPGMAIGFGEGTFLVVISLREFNALRRALEEGGG